MIIQPRVFHLYSTSGCGNYSIAFASFQTITLLTLQAEAGVGKSSFPSCSLTLAAIFYLAEGQGWQWCRAGISCHRMVLFGYIVCLFFTLQSVSGQECKFCARLLAVRWSEDTEGPSLGFEESSGNERKSIVYKHHGEMSC